MARGLGLQLAADYGTIDKDTPSYKPMPGLDGITIIDGANFLSNTAGDPVAIVIGSHESNYTEPFEVTSRVSVNVGLPQPIVQEFKRKFWLAVALAPYRSAKKWGQYNVNLDATVQGRREESWKLAPNNTAPDSNRNYVSSQSTQEHMDAGWKADSSHWWTSKQLTDALVRYSDTEAAKFCRTITVTQGGTSVAMDLPNIDCLMRIYQARQYIDSKDPTLKVFGGTTYKDWNLTKWSFPGANYTYVWSSSPLSGSTYKSWSVQSNGYVSHSGGNNRNSAHGVVPALEIPVT